MNSPYEVLRSFCVLTGCGAHVLDANGETVFRTGNEAEPLIRVKTGIGTVYAGPFSAGKKAGAAEAVLQQMFSAQRGREDTPPESLYGFTAERANRVRYSYTKEKELIASVRIGDGPRVRRVINELLGEVLFTDFKNIRTIRVRAIELSSLLSRVAIDGGASGDRMLAMNEKFVPMVEDAENVDEICALLMRIADTFMESMFSEREMSQPIRKAVRYLSESFASPVTLEITARLVGLAPTYFSAVFKKETGATFREYLNRVRIEEAKRLLSDTDFGIVDIALATGFSEQSYFTKVFRKYTGMNPKQYRNRR